MKLTLKSHYAARAVLGLARHYPVGVALRVEQLAAEQGVPANYLAQILLDLKAHGLARSVRGKAGGYLLARPPGEITLADVLHAVEGRLFDLVAPQTQDCPPELRRAWQRLEAAIETTADAITFQQLLEEGGDKEKMYYI